MTIACFCGTVYKSARRVNVCPDCGTTTTVPTLTYVRTLEQIRSLPETEDLLDRDDCRSHQAQQTAIVRSVRWRNKHPKPKDAPPSAHRAEPSGTPGGRRTT